MKAKIVRLLLGISNKFYNTWIKLFMVPYWKESFKKIGDKVFIGKKCTLTYSHIELGNNVFIGDYASFIASIAYIHIGNDVMFDPNITIRGVDHRTDVVRNLPVREKKRFTDEEIAEHECILANMNTKKILLGR